MNTASAASAANTPDYAPLLEALPGPSPAGVDLSFDPVFKAIAEARRGENPRLPQGVWAHEVKRADWLAVEALCREALARRSKDLQVACWLAEAWVNRLGFGGLAPGLGLLAGLCERFWTELYPQRDGDDLGPRLAPFEWLNERLPIAMRTLPIAVAEANPEEFYSWTDYVNAQLLEGLRQRDAKAVERSEAGGAVTLAAFGSVRARTAPRFWRQLEADLTAGRAALEALKQALQAACGGEAPGLGGIGGALDDLTGLAAATLKELQPRAAATRPPAATAAPGVVGVSSAPAAQEGLTRAEIYAQLGRLADLLQELEPHSPAPYLIRRAVEWGAMPFSELIMHFSRAGMQLEQLVDVLGLDAMINDHDVGNIDKK